jgi:hypothetical protein
MYGFISSVGFINYINEMILKFRILRRAKRLGVKNVSPLLDELAEMISKLSFWISFVSIGSVTIVMIISFLGSQVNDYSALIVALVAGLFILLRFLGRKPLKALILHLLLAGVSK